jgi:uncharacterized protein YbcI
MNVQPTQDPLGRDGSHPAVATISRALVHLYAEYFSRGPTKAKTIWSEDVVVCVFEDVFTRGEQVLVDAGRFAEVRRRRQAFQDEIEPLIRDAVECATGRSVESFLGQVNEDGMAVDVLTLGRPVTVQ